MPNVAIDILEQEIASFELKRDLRGKSPLTYRNSLVKFYKWFSELDMTEFNSWDDVFLKYKNFLREERGEISYKYNLFGIAKNFVESCTHCSIATKNFSRESCSKKFPISDSKIEKLINTHERLNPDELEDKILRDVIITKLSLFNCLRQISIVRLNMKDVYFLEDNSIAISFIGKGRDEGKLMKISTSNIKFLKEYYYRRQKQGASGEDPLFVSTSNNNKGKRMTTKAIYDILKEVLIDLGSWEKNRITPHCFKRTGVQSGFKLNHDILRTLELSDHKSLETLLLYLRQIQFMDDGVSSDVEKYYENLIKKEYLNES